MRRPLTGDADLAHAGCHRVAAQSQVAGAPKIDVAREESVDPKRMIPPHTTLHLTIVVRQSRSIETVEATSSTLFYYAAAIFFRPQAPVHLADKVKGAVSRVALLVVARMLMRVNAG